MFTERPAGFAGLFYPRDADACGRMADEFLCGIEAEPAVAAIVPHAGWMYSGSTAALGLAAIAAARPATVVIFGAAHRADRNPASVFPSGAWQTPLGSLLVDEDFASHLLRLPEFRSAPEAHASEHSIEVQLPLLKRLLPDARIVPINVRPGPEAAAIGQACGREAVSSGSRCCFVGSTDLTHYGPAFGFEPHGHGRAGIRWAMEVNDRRFVALIKALAAEGVVPEAAAHRNACGPGAVAATIAAAREIGATEYVELRHTCSAEIAGVGDPDPANSVGYEAGVFVLPR